MIAAAAARPSSEQPAISAVQPQILLGEARQQFEKGNLTESESLYKQAAGFQETAADAFYGLGVVYTKAGNSAAALVAFQQTVKRSPQNSNAYYYLGQIWEQQGSTEAALGFFRTALQINPSHYGARQRLAALSHAEPPQAHQGGRTDTPKSPESRDCAASPSLGITAVLKGDGSPLSKEVLRAIDQISMTVTPRLSAFATPLLRRFFLLVCYWGLLKTGLIMKLYLTLLHVSKVSSTLPSLIFNVVIPITMLLFILVKILNIKTARIALDEGRVRITKGIFARTTQTAELYRVEDLELHQSFLNRMTGDGTIILHTKEKGKSTSLELAGLAGIDKLRTVFDQLRSLVLMLRTGPWGKGVVW